MHGDSASLSSGSVLHGTYVLEERLGSGGMGTVWRARHLRLPRSVAIKVLHEQAYESEELLLRFRREAEITSQLGHPHIVEVFDFNVLEDGRAYLVMELLEGQSLRERMKAGPRFSTEEAVVILQQVASALARAHRAGIVHRDLKPENVFLLATSGARPHAKVLDFGISKIQGAETVLTKEMSLLGTPRYMSPEQARGESDRVDGRADQFALGAIAYEMLAGKPAFEGGSVAAVLLEVLDKDPAPLEAVAPETPPPLAAAVRRALSKEPSARFRDLEVFGLALGGSALVDAQPGMSAPFSRPSVELTDPEAIEDTLKRPYRPDVVGEEGGGSRSPNAGRGPGAGFRRGDLVVSRWLAALLGVGGLTAGLSLALFGLERPPLLERSTPAERDHGLAATEPSPPVGAPGPRGLAPAEPGPPVGAPAPRGLAAAEPSPAVGAPAGRSRPSADEKRGPDAGEPSGSPPALGSEEARRPPRHPVRPEPVPARLRGAQIALRGRRYDEAIRLARRSLQEEDDPRAFGALAIAYCGKRDLGAAQAMLRRTPRSGQAEVRRACRRMGMDLVP